ncbi:MAG: zinc ribbon domain-containing protein [Ruminococcus sp.]|uniref:hypothetical protein n=1 Tax=Ruminococcus sp. TaxID=41978 RepID=UPI001B0BADC8|nr:hypothetical protein [Ruminococcus sp.]MBO7473174.1 zinc ribbon domain-containing protein [Ruminococcus sp.]MBP5432715.1 zinc ribbon domain-containing protein [Ruminococcus sp.]
MKSGKDNNSESMVKICGNCREIIEDDNFCRYCGAKIIKNEYAPEKDMISIIYGPPPVERKHICSNCGYTWKKWAMIDKEQYCPKCGGEIVTEETGEKLL